MMFNNDYLVWFCARWMRQNMCASCRILHDPIVFRNLLWWGNMPSLLIGSESTGVYVREATDGWIFLRSYLDFPMYVLVLMIVSTILQSSRWWISRVGIPHTTWRIHVLGSSSHQSILSGCGIEWQACVVAYSCDKLLASHAILAGILIPPIPCLIALSPTTEAIRVMACGKIFLLGKHWPAWWWGTICGVRIVYYYWNVSLLRVGDIKFCFPYWIHVF